MLRLVSAHRQVRKTAATLNMESLLLTHGESSLGSQQGVYFLPGQRMGALSRVVVMGLPRDGPVIKGNFQNDMEATTIIGYII